MYVYNFLLDDFIIMLIFYKCMIYLFLTVGAKNVNHDTVSALECRSRLVEIQREPRLDGRFKKDEA